MLHTEGRELIGDDVLERIVSRTTRLAGEK